MGSWAHGIIAYLHTAPLLVCDLCPLHGCLFSGKIQVYWPRLCLFDPEGERQRLVIPAPEHNDS